MRRKSERTKAKSPEPSVPAAEPPAKAERPKRGRPSRKRRKSSSSEDKESGSESNPQQEVQIRLPEQSEGAHADRRKSGEGNCDNETEPVWQVKKSESSGDSGEIQKLKICLARPPSTPERPDRSPRAKKRSSHSSVDTSSDTGEEKKKRHKSRRNSQKDVTTGEEASETEELEDKMDQVPEQENIVETSQGESEISQGDGAPPEVVSFHQQDKDTKQVEEEPINDLSCDNVNKKEEPQASQVNKAVNTISVKDVAKVETATIPDVGTDNCVNQASNKDDKNIENNEKVEEQQTQGETHTDVKEIDVKEDSNDKSHPSDSAGLEPENNISCETGSDGLEVIKSTSVMDEVLDDDNNKEVISTNEVAKPEIEEILSEVTIKETLSGVIIEEKVAEVKNETTAETGAVRKRRWGSRSSKVSKLSTVSISTDSLKNLIPNVEPVSVEDVVLEVKTKDVQMGKIITDEKIKPNGKYTNIQEKPKEKEILGNATHRKISVVSDGIPMEQRSPSPPKHRSSSVLYITNLVRPFTLPQLKNLLLRTGKIVENGFWIDKIKSRCYVQYQNDDEAIETRHALHGVTWPVSNPKTLVVDFSSESAMREAMDSEEDKPVVMVESRSKESAKENDFRRENDMHDKRVIVREWDVGKEDLVKPYDDVSSRGHGHGQGVGGRYLRDQPDVDRNDKRKRRSKSPSPARKFKKKEDEAPSKLLDDLFRKTKATPCIYWLPLNAETILIKEEQRRKHMAEHERRMEELRKANEEHRPSRNYHASNRHR